MMESRMLVVCLLVLMVHAAGAQDLTVDAVTRATELNPSTGDIAVLTDGRTPATDENAQAFAWDVAGFLVVEWSRPVQLSAIRVYLGDMDRYALYGYLGGSFNSTGQREGTQTPLYSREGLGPFGEQGWFDMVVPEGAAEIDNLGIQFTGGATLYEIQFLGPQETVIEPTTLGVIKLRHGNGRRRWEANVR